MVPTQTSDGFSLVPSIIKSLHGERLEVYKLSIDSEVKRVYGHFDVCVYLKNEKDEKSLEPCIKGLYSVGRQDSTYHFFDAQFFPYIRFSTKEVNLIEENLADDLFKLLGAIIRPGGQFYLSYLNEEMFTSQMEKAFKLGIPPIATVLGRLLFMSGCIHVRSFYGVEGRFRVDGEKPISSKITRKWAHEILDELNKYIASEEKKILLDDRCRKNAQQVIEYLNRIIDHCVI